MGTVLPLSKLRKMFSGVGFHLPDSGRVMKTSVWFFPLNFSGYR